MNDQVREALRRASKAVEAPRRRTEDVVRKLAENPDFDLLDVSGMARDLFRLGKEQAGKARSIVDDRLRRRLNDLGLASREEVEKLRRRVAELEATSVQTPATEGPAGPAPGSAAEPAAPPRRRAAARGRAGATPTPAEANPAPAATAAPAKHPPAPRPAAKRAPAARRAPATKRAPATGNGSPPAEPPAE